MQLHSNTEGIVSIEELIAGCKPVVERLARKFVAWGSSLLDFDDYVSVGMIKVWESAEAIFAADIPLAYACKVAENAMMEEYNRLHKFSSVSIDAPLKSGSTFSLADLLPDTSLALVSARSSKKERALNGAVRRLPARQRAVVRRYYALPGYGETSSEVIAQRVQASTQAVRDLTYHGRKALRKDALLCAAVGVGVGQ